MSIRHSQFYRLATIFVALMLGLTAPFSAIPNPVAQQERKTSGFAFPAQYVSQTAPEEPYSVSKRARVFALILLGERILAVGSRGLALVSDSLNGEMWSSVALPAAPNLYAGLEDSSGRVWLASDAGQLYSGNAELKSWSKVDLQEDSSVYAITELTGGSLIAVGQYGLIKMKTVGSEEWKTVDLPWDEWLQSAWQQFGEAMPHLFGTCHSGTSLFIVGEFGLVLKYDGRRWVRLHGGSIEPALYSCATREEQLIVVGQRGAMLRSTDAGETWSANYVSSSSIYKVVALPGDNWLAVGEERQIWWVEKPDSVWKCGRVDTAATGWFVDALLSPQGKLVTLAGAGVLRSLKLDNSDAPILPKAFACG